MQSHPGKASWGIKPTVLGLIAQNKHSLISPGEPEYLVLKHEFFVTFSILVTAAVSGGLSAG